MLKLKLLLIASLFFSCSLFAQNLWTSEVMINFTIEANTKIASFVDASGIHIVYFRNGGIKYALVNSQGGIIKYNKLIESEGAGTDFANVTIAGGNLYAIYFKNNDIKIARSTNQGDTWTNTFSYFDLINTGCNKIVAYSDGSNLHITWSEISLIDNNNYDAHYIKFNPASPQPWQDYKRVSDVETQYTVGGENPDLVINAGKVYVNYVGTYWPFPINRDRNVNNTWNTPEEIPFAQLPMTDRIMGIKPLITGNELNTIYANSYFGPSSGDLIGYSYKNISGNSWTQNSNYLLTDHLNAYSLYPFVAANTNDGKIHFIYWDKNQSLYSYRQINNHDFSDHIANIPLTNQPSNILISNSNDLYLLKTGNTSTPSKIRFIHYDAAPLAPQNFQITNSGSPYYHPVLSWNQLNEPDVRIKSNGLRVERNLEVLGQWSTWTEIAAISGSSNNYTDSEIFNATGSGNGRAKYRIRSYDDGGHYSPYSNEITIRFGTSAEKIVVLGGSIVEQYKLNQNFPNPFNPNTKISYSIKEEGLVTLKIYDVLGKEIATLVNENKPEGNYEADFSASQLPSGMYIYKLQSGSFSDVKKMLLTK